MYKLTHPQLVKGMDYGQFLDTVDKTRMTSYKTKVNKFEVIVDNDYIVKDRVEQVTTALHGLTLDRDLILSDPVVISGIKCRILRTSDFAWWLGVVLEPNLYSNYKGLL